MTFTPVLAAPPWHWWIAVNLLVLDVILLIGVGILYYRMVVAPWRSTRRPAVADRPNGDREDRAIGAGDGR